jgi:amidase
MTRTVEDCALLLEAVAGYDGIDDRMLGAPVHPPSYHADLIQARSSGITGLRIGVLKEGFTNPHLDPRVDALVRQAIKDLGSLGAEVVEVSAPLWVVETGQL